MDEAKKSWMPSVFLTLGLFVCATAVIQLWPDRHYYLLPASQRPLHSHHAILRSSGTYGLSFGLIGAGLIMLNLSYLIRKRLIALTWLGSLRSWMAFHVFTGLVAGVLVLLHSGFQPRSALGSLGFVAMSIVVITGLIGRYIYAHSPRSLKGVELEIDELRHDLDVYKQRLEKMGMPHEFFKSTLSTHGVQGIPAALLAMVASDRQRKRELNSLRQWLMNQPRLRPMANEILPLAERYYRELQWLASYHQLRSVMSSWRFLHRWLALVLVSAVIFHIVVAFQLGDLRWPDMLIKLTRFAQDVQANIHFF